MILISLLYSFAAEYGDWSLHYGYLDSKPMFKGTSSQGEIHFRVEITDTNFLWLCGSHKESFLHAAVHLDLDVALPDDKARQQYTPSAQRRLWTNKKYVGFECKAILDIPKGLHVLSIGGNGTSDAKATSLTHIIMWH